MAADKVVLRYISGYVSSIVDSIHNSRLKLALYSYNNIVGAREASALAILVNWDFQKYYELLWTVFPITIVCG